MYSGLNSVYISIQLCISQQQHAPHSTSYSTVQKLIWSKYLNCVTSADMDTSIEDSTFKDSHPAPVNRNTIYNSTPCPKKTKQICFCQNFVKFPPILIIFGRKMGNDPNICEVHSFSTSPNLCHHLTLLNANVPNCYITPNVVICNKLLTT